MDDDTTPADRAGMDVERLDARIQEIERRMERDRERLKTLRARRNRKTAVADGKDENAGRRPPQVAVMESIRDRAEDSEEDWADAETVLDLLTSNLYDREELEGALEDLMRKGEVYEPSDGKVRVT